jgi:hypothetical protein
MKYFDHRVANATAGSLFVANLMPYAFDARTDIHLQIARRQLRVVDDVGITLTDNACAYRFVARSRGRPHLICENGEVTIRDFRPDA